MNWDLVRQSVATRKKTWCVLLIMTIAGLSLWILISNARRPARTPSSPEEDVTKIISEILREHEAAREREKRLSPEELEEYEALHSAAGEGDLVRVKKLISGGVDVHRRDRSSNTPLHYAMNVDVAKVLIANGADVNARGQVGITPLTQAATWGTPELATVLIKAGARVNVRFVNPLTMAITAKRFEVAQILIDHGADVNARDLVPPGGTPLHAAADLIREPNAIAGVSFLLSRGAEASVNDNEGATPLHRAAGYTGSDRVIKLLVDAGAAPRSPFLRAIMDGDTERAEKLLGNNAEIIQEVDAFGWTGLHWAAATKQEEVASLLLSREGKVSAKDKDGKSPLYYACSRGDYAMAKLLLDSGAKMDRADEDTVGCVTHATAKGHVKILKLLLDSGAKADWKSPRSLFLEKQGDEMIHVAAAHGQVETAKVLLAKGANVNAKGCLAETALYRAVEQDQKSFVEFLLERGADVNAKNCEGWTPLALASVWRNQAKRDPIRQEIEDILREHGGSE